MSASFGVHVGNSCACIAVSKDGKSDVVANAAGDRVTPAMVGFGDDEINVGLSAKQSKIRNLSNTVTNNKALLSGPQPPESSPVTIIQKEGGGYLYQVDYKEKELKVSPEEILKHIYKYMHDIAASHCANVDDSNTVITVPHAYQSVLRDRVRECAQAAGFRVVQVISEPVAACLAHALEQELDRRYVLVYRVGGSTMNATLLLVSGGCYSVLDSINLSLGGEAITDVITNYLGKEFRNKYKEDILVNKRARAKLSMEAEKVKHVLSTLDTAHCFVESLYDGMDFSTNVTRARFDNEISKVISDLLAPITELFSRCKLNTSDVSNVIISGGSTKIVKLQKQLASLFPSAEMNLNIAPDECIAVGAAVQASLIVRENAPNLSTKMLSISKDINALSDIFNGGKMVIVHADTTLPFKRNIQLDAPSEEGEVNVKLVFGPDLPLSTLSVPADPKSKLFLGIHIHRDGSTHFTLTDKASGKSSDHMLKQPAL